MPLNVSVPSSVVVVDVVHCCNALLSRYAAIRGIPLYCKCVVQQSGLSDFCAAWRD